MDKSVNEKLGALRFQKVVFKVEDLKFKFIDKFCPNIGNWYSSYCDRKVKRLCRNKTLEEQASIKYNYNCKKMAFNKELVTKKNRNYHISINDVDNFQRYLDWNKSVHKKGIVKNLVCILGSSILVLVGSGVVIPLASIYLGYNILSLGINFECVNLQNYNLKRLEEKKDILKKISSRERDKDAKKYGEIGEVIYDKLQDDIALPKSSDIISSMKTKEELLKLRELALEVKKSRDKENMQNQAKVKKR